MTLYGYAFPTCELLLAATNMGQIQNWYCLSVPNSTYFEAVENWQINYDGKFVVSNVEQVSYV